MTGMSLSAFGLGILLALASGCGEAGAGGLDPLVMRLEELELRWVYGQQEPGGSLSARVEVEFYEPWDLCIVEAGVEQVHTLSVWRPEPESDLPLSSYGSWLRNPKVGKAVRGLTLSGPLSRRVPRDVEMVLRIFTCPTFDSSGRTLNPGQRFLAPDPDLVPSWRTTFEPTND